MSTFSSSSSTILESCFFVFLTVFGLQKKSSLAPSLATGLLPLIINTNEWSFVIIVFTFTFLLMLGVLAFGLNQGLKKKVNIQYKYMLVLLVLAFVWIGLCWSAGYQQLAVIPPVLVVAYESLHKPMYGGKMALKQGLVLTLSPAVGTLLYLTLHSLIWITVLDMLLMLALSLIVGFPENISRSCR